MFTKSSEQSPVDAARIAVKKALALYHKLSHEEKWSMLPYM